MNSWYTELKRPPLTPPDWIFGPVWTVLYLMIATSIVLYVVSRARQRPYKDYGLIAVHLLSNFIWTPLFFGLQSPGWALIDILLLDLTLAVMILRFWKHRPLASILLWPYALWVSFATYLNIGFHLLN